MVCRTRTEDLIECIEIHRYLCQIDRPGGGLAPYMAGADDGQRIYVNPNMRLVVVVASDLVQRRSRSQSQADAVINDIVLRVIRR